MGKAPMSADETDATTKDPAHSYQHLKTGRAKAALSGVIWSSFNSLAPAAVGAGVFTITSRFLSPSEFGIVAFAASIAGFASAVAPVGFGEAIVQHRDITKKHLDTVFWLCMASAVVIYVALLMAAWPLSFMTGEAELALFVPIVGARVIFDLAATVPNALLTRSMSFNRLAIRTTMASIVSAIVCLSVLAMGYGAWALALSQLSAAVAASIAALVSVRWRPGWHFDRAALADLKRFGLFASGNRILTTINVDQLMVGSLLGAGPLGLYGFAQRIYQILSQLLVGVLSSVSFPLLSTLRNEHEKLREVYLSATFISSAASFPIFVGLASVASDLIPLVFGPQWIDALWALRAFCLIGLLACVGVLQSSLIRSQGKVDWWMWYMVANQVLTATVVLCFYRFGVSVMVCAIALKTCLYWPVSAVMTAKLLKISPLSYLRPFLLPTFAALLMFLCVILAQRSLADVDPVVRLAAEIGCGAVVYLVAILSLGWRRVVELMSIVKRTHSNA